MAKPFGAGCTIQKTQRSSTTSESGTFLLPGDAITSFRRWIPFTPDDNPDLVIYIARQR
jgi:hypothetical protein